MSVRVIALVVGVIHLLVFGTLPFAAALADDDVVDASGEGGSAFVDATSVRDGARDNWRVDRNPVQVETAAAAARAVASLSVPEPVIVFGPEPTVNQWKVLAVGFPIWVWLEDPGQLGTSVSQDGIDIAMSASMGTVTFDWGDGTTSTCTQMRPRPPRVEPMTPSPDCGHTYMKAGDYTVTATASWAVNWQALGQSGQIPLSSSAARTMPIRQFRTVVVG